MAVADLITAAFANLADAPNSMITAAQGMGSSLVGLGMVFLTMAFLAELTTATYSWWLGGDAASFLSRVFRLAIITAIPLAALQSWSSASGFIPTFLQGDVTKSVAGGVNPMSMLQAITRIIDIFWRDMLTQLENFKPDVAPGASGWLDQASNAISSTLGAPIQAFLSIVAKIFAFVIFIILVGIPAVIFGAVLLATVYGSQIVGLIGVIFGPILICWLPWQPMSWLFQNWIKFMMKTGLTYAVAMVIATICKTGATAVTANITGGASGDVGPLGVVAMILPLCFALGVTLLFMSYILHKSEDIASSLIDGGSPGMGGTVSSIVRNMRQVSGSKGGNSNKSNAPKPENKNGSGANKNPGGGKGGGGSGGGGRSPSVSPSSVSQSASASSSQSSSPSTSKGWFQPGNPTPPSPPQRNP